MNEELESAAGPLTASLVVSETGSAVSPNGSSKGLGNQTDSSLLKWFRSRSQIVFTSGKTAEIENYRYPSSAGLAILSRTDRSYHSLGSDVSKVILLRNLESYSAALAELASMGFTKIHSEFGPTGFIELVNLGLVDGFVSSIEVSGIEAFAKKQGLVIETMQQINGDLHVARLLGRG